MRTKKIIASLAITGMTAGGAAAAPAVMTAIQQAPPVVAAVPAAPGMVYHG